MDSLDSRLRDALGRMASEAPEPTPFEDLGTHQLGQAHRRAQWNHRPASAFVASAAFVVALGLLGVIALGPEDPSPLPASGGRTLYESLDLSSPTDSVEAFTEAFAADDFLTVWLIFDMQAQLAVTNALSTGDYRSLVNLDDLVPEENGRYAPLPSDMETTDAWWLFDFLMLNADEDGAFLIDLSGRTTVTDQVSRGGSVEVEAEVEGIEGTVTFYLSESPAGRWRVSQIRLPGGDPSSIPWSP